MEHSKVIAILNEIEERFPVNSWKASEFHVWPLIRIEIAMKLYSLFKPSANPEKINNVAQKPLVGPGFFNKLKSISNWENRSLKHKLDDFKMRFQLKSNAKVLFLSFAASRVEFNGSAFNKQVDPIINYLNNSEINSLLLELKYNIQQNIDPSNKNQCICIDQHMRFYLWNNRSIDLDALYLDGYEEFMDFLEQRVGLKFDDLRGENLRIKIKNFILLIAYFKEILLRNKTKLSFVTCYYAMPCMALSAASKTLGIPCVDIQHGLQVNHAAYTKWSKVPVDGYSALPSMFWCWSHIETKIIMDWAKGTNGKHKAVIAGNTWNEIWQDEALSKGSYIESLERTNPTGKSFNILYTMQPLNDALPDFFMQAIKRSPADWKWWIRIHPRQINDIEKIKKLLEQGCGFEKVELKMASEFPLPVLLQHTDIHITLFSSVVIEAADFGVPSIIMHKNGLEIFNSEIESGYAVYEPGDSTKLIGVIEHLKLMKISGLGNRKTSSFRPCMDELIRQMV
ncbi:MAG: hypothetical protein H0V01_14270 [Bacteroidetes bacterium]|nr:hypothetical protein [Bacteroidota bacterium]HET6244694.1 hypothetical protein [Bacteroidia bacterium]